MAKKKEWCWVSRDALGEVGVLAGPFPSRDEALRDARDSFLDVHLPQKIYLGTVRYILPEDFLPRYDIDDLLEQMEQALADDDLAFEDPIFFANRKKEDASRSLQEALKKWIRIEISSDGWVMDDAQKKEITLEVTF
jgi:hypothetical protein